MRTAILGAARELVASEGAGGLSMRAIARELGYSPAALYEYFPGKEDIFCALYFEGAEGLAGRLRATLAALPDAPSAVRLVALGHAYRQYALEQPELYRLALGGGAAYFTLGETQKAQGREAFQLLIDTAREGIDGGSFRQVQPEALALACWAVVHGFVLIELSGMIEQKFGAGSPSTDDLFHATLDVMSAGFMRR